jgi:tetratricopeptide (TPR) repeat protein
MGQEVAQARRNHEHKRRELGPDVLETLYALDELAALHLDREEPAEAEPLFRQSLESELHSFGEEHPATIAARKNLARALKEQKKWAEAVALYRQGLEVYRRAQGAEHPDVLVAMNDLADALEAQSNPDEADGLWQQCLQGWESLMGSRHPEARAAASKLISKRQAHGKPVEIEFPSLAVSNYYAEMSWWNKAVMSFGKSFDKEMPADADLCSHYARLLVYVGDTAGYRKLCGRMLEQYQGKNEHHTLSHTFVLAPRALPDAGRIVELAKRRLAEAQPGSVDHIWSVHVLGFAYYRAGQYEKALETLNSFLIEPAREGFDVANWMLQAMTEERLGHHEKAVAWLDKADRWMVQHESLSLFPSHEWSYGLLIQRLHREAETLIRGKTADQPPQK